MVVVRAVGDDKPERTHGVRADVVDYRAAEQDARRSTFRRNIYSVIIVIKLVKYSVIRHTKKTYVFDGATRSASAVASRVNQRRVNRFSSALFCER